MKRSSMPLWLVFLLGGIGSLFLYAALPLHTAESILVIGLNLAVLTAGMVGLRRFRPPHPQFWRLLLISQGLRFLGDVTWAAQIALRSDAPFPSLGDAFMLGGFICIPLAIISLFHFNNLSWRETRSRLLDASVVAIGLDVVMIVFVINPFVQTNGLTSFQRAATIAYPTLAIFSQVLIIDLWRTPVGRKPAYILVGLSVIIYTTSSILYGGLLISAARQGAGMGGLTWFITDLLFGVAYALFGAALLHPSMSAVTGGDVRRARRLSRADLIILVSSTLLPPLALFISALTGQVDVFTISLGMSTVGVVILWRMVLLVQEGEIQLHQLREQGHQLAEAENRLRHLAFHDVLTGLPNRALFMELLEHALQSAQRENSVGAVLFMDLDHFKKINDTLGHAAGDLLLQKLGARLARVLRKNDTVSRFGGDEFVMLIENLQQSQCVTLLAGRILAAVAEPFELPDGTVRVSASLGICPFPAPGDTPQELIDRADQALYEAKRLGRNNYQFYQPDLGVEE